MGGKELRIDVKLVVLSAVLITLIIAVVGLWSAKTHEQQLRQELVEQARGFAQQMDAVDFRRRQSKPHQLHFGRHIRIQGTALLSCGKSGSPAVQQEHRLRG